MLWAAALTLALPATWALRIWTCDGVSGVEPAAGAVTGAVLNVFDRSTSYGGGAHGYTDYPTLDAAALVN